MTLYIGILALALYSVLSLAAWSPNPLTQIKWLRDNPGVAVGIVVVTLLFGGSVAVFGEPYTELGLDAPNRGSTEQCPRDARLGIGSNLYGGVAKHVAGPVAALVEYNHQSCAVESDRNSVDRVCGGVRASGGSALAAVTYCTDGRTELRAYWRPVDDGSAYFGPALWVSEWERVTAGVVLGYRF